VQTEVNACDYSLFWGKTQLTHAETTQLEAVLTDSERTRWKSLDGPRAQRYVAGRFLARTLGAEVLQRNWSEVIPQASCDDCGMDHGAISIENSDIHVSLSSSGDDLVAAGARGRLIGVDIEQGNLEELHEVAGDVGNIHIALSRWCEYEAVVKALGAGIHLGIDKVHFEDVPEGFIASTETSTTEFMVGAATQHGKVVLAVALGR
jgi:4'-phosphopantetheinyl transferase